MSLEQIQDFLDASQEYRFEGRGREEMYEWVKKTLVGQQYHIQGKAEKGLVRSYLGKMTGLSRAQVTRLIGQYLDKGSIAEKRYSRRRFPSVYTRADIGLLAEVDEAHETLSGPATQKILYREYHEFGNSGYRRLAKISMTPIYNLAKSIPYRNGRSPIR